jgi:hypothetical protein
MDDIIALIPVNRVAAQRKMPKPWDMPHTPLYRRLRDKARRRVLRSGGLMAPLGAEEADLRPAGTAWARVPGLKGVRWREASKTFSDEPRHALYYDLEVTAAD